MSSSASSYYEDDLARVLKALASDVNGLTNNEVSMRRKEYGLNRIERLKKPSKLLVLLSNFTHMMALLLWAGGFIAVMAGMLQLAIAIWSVNVINGVFSFWQEYQAEKATEALMELVPKNARVLRDGIESIIPAEQLVPGDIINVAEGDDIPADARLIVERGLFVDQSMLTGESAPIRKTTNGNQYYHPNRGHSEVLYGGTSVTAGDAQAIVIATGINSRFGKIAHLTQSIRNDESPLQKEMVRVTKTVTVLAVAIGITFFLIAVLILDVKMADSFIFALGMIVAFVPEGMLPTVSLSLAIAVRKMSQRNAIVRRLSSVETLGCTTVICSDKTGTLTRNEMTLVAVWGLDSEVELTGAGYNPEGEVLFKRKSADKGSSGNAMARIVRCGAMCSNATLVAPNSDCPDWTITGDPTEAAILVASRKLKRFEICEAEQKKERIDSIAFDPHRKRMSALWRENGKFVAYVKGAPKEILQRSVAKIDANGKASLEDNDREHIVNAIDDYAKRGMRVIAVAERSFEAKPKAEEAVLENELTFLGLLAMVDPLHQEVPLAVERCRQAGIRVIMITGDYEITARSIARQAGIIISEEARVVTGDQLRELDDDEIVEILKDEVVFARTSPEDKLRIVKTLQSAGHIVAVTGDGVNDAPALKQADIGIAMGRSGTDVARESSDIVLIDDNFASIVAAVELGRAVYENIRKFALYVFTSNVAEAVPFAVLLFSRGLIPLPITLMQVLLIDLGTDMVPAIGLGADPPVSDTMQRPPRDSSQPLLSQTLLAKVFFWYGLIEAIAALSAYFFVNWSHGWPSTGFAPVGTEIYRAATTAAITAVVVCQIGTVICCRTNRASAFSVSLLNNKLLLAGIATELLLLVGVMIIEPLQSVFGTTRLPLSVVPLIVSWLPILIVLDESRKWFVRESESRRTEKI